MRKTSAGSRPYDNQSVYSEPHTGQVTRNPAARTCSSREGQITLKSTKHSRFKHWKAWNWKRRSRRKFLMNNDSLDYQTDSF